MTKLFASLFAAALVIGLGFAPTLTHAEHHEGASKEAAEKILELDKNREFITIFKC